MNLIPYPTKNKVDSAGQSHLEKTLNVLNELSNQMKALPDKGHIIFMKICIVFLRLGGLTTLHAIIQNGLQKKFGKKVYDHLQRMWLCIY